MAPVSSEIDGPLLPLLSRKVPAGFPSPADDHLDESLDLIRYLIPNPPATYLMRAQGDSMIEAGILPNALLVVDRSLEPTHGEVVIAVIEGEFLVKQLVRTPQRVALVACNSARSYPAIEIREDTALQIWGVVRFAINPQGRSHVRLG